MRGSPNTFCPRDGGARFEHREKEGKKKMREKRRVWRAAGKNVDETLDVKLVDNGVLAITGQRVDVGHCAWGRNTMAGREYRREQGKRYEIGKQGGENIRLLCQQQDEERHTHQTAAPA